MGKLLAVAALGEKFYGRWLSYRLLSQILLLLGLTIILALLIASLLLCAVYTVHLALVYQGVATWVAWSVSFLLVIAMIATTVWRIRRCLREFNTAPQNLLQKTMSVAQAFPAFWAGFTKNPKA
jgi:hypothetical protein